MAGESNGGSVRSESVRLGSAHFDVVRAASATQAGVLLYPTINGIDDVMYGFASAFADAGITAVIWDPYNGRARSEDPLEMFARSRECEDREVVGDLRAIVDHMQGELGLASIGGAGWCFGGRIGLIHAGSDDRVSVLSTYNPTIFTDTPINVAGQHLSRADFEGQTLDEWKLAPAINGPVQVCHPELDFTPLAVYERLIEALRKRPAPTIYQFYPGADHGFWHIPGEANERATRFAWPATLSFFSQNLQIG